MSARKSIEIRFPQGQPDDYEHAPGPTLRGIRDQLRQVGITVRRVPRQPSFAVSIRSGTTLYPEDVLALWRLGRYIQE